MGSPFDLGMRVDGSGKKPNMLAGARLPAQEDKKEKPEEAKEKDEVKLGEYGSNRFAFSHYLGVGVGWLHRSEVLKHLGEIPGHSGTNNVTAALNFDVGAKDNAVLSFQPYLSFDGAVGFEEIGDKIIQSSDLNTGLIFMAQRLGGFDRIAAIPNSLRLNLAYSKYKSDVANYPNPRHELFKLNAGFNLFRVGPVALDANYGLERGQKAGFDFTQHFFTPGLRFSYKTFDSFVGYRLEKSPRELVKEKDFSLSGKLADNVSHGLVVQAILDSGGSTVVAKGYVDLDRTYGQRRWGGNADLYGQIGSQVFPIAVGLGIGWEREDAIFGAGAIQRGPWTFRLGVKIPLLFTRNTHHRLYCFLDAFLTSGSLEFKHDKLPKDFPIPADKFRVMKGGINLTFSWEYKLPRSGKDDYPDEVNAFRTRSRMNYMLADGLREMHDIVPGEKIAIERAKALETAASIAAKKMEDKMNKKPEETTEKKPPVKKPAVAPVQKPKEAPRPPQPQGVNIGKTTPNSVEIILPSGQLKDSQSVYLITIGNTTVKRTEVEKGYYLKLLDNFDLSESKEFGGLKPDTEYKVWVKIRDKTTGKESAPVILKFKTPELPLAQPVSNLQAIPGSHSVIVKWKPPEGGVDKYQIFLYDDKSTEGTGGLHSMDRVHINDDVPSTKMLKKYWKPLRDYSQEATKNIIPLTGLNPNTEYTVAVVSIKEGQEENCSKLLDFKTLKHKLLLSKKPKTFIKKTAKNPAECDKKGGSWVPLLGICGFNKKK